MKMNLSKQIVLVKKDEYQKFAEIVTKMGLRTISNREWTSFNPFDDDLMINGGDIKVFLRKGTWSHAKANTATSITFPAFHKEYLLQQLSEGDREKVEAGKWCIERTEENYKEINVWINETFPASDTYTGKGYFVHSRPIRDSRILPSVGRFAAEGYPSISLDLFRLLTASEPEVIFTTADGKQYFKGQECEDVCQLSEAGTVQYAQIRNVSKENGPYRWYSSKEALMAAIEKQVEGQVVEPPIWEHPELCEALWAFEQYKEGLKREFHCADIDGFIKSKRKPKVLLRTQDGVDCKVGGTVFFITKHEDVKHWVLTKDFEPLEGNPYFSTSEAAQLHLDTQKLLALGMTKERMMEVLSGMK